MSRFNTGFFIAWVYQQELSMYNTVFNIKFKVPMTPITAIYV